MINSNKIIIFKTLLGSPASSSLDHVYCSICVSVGNIRQGPVGYVPNCHCESNKPGLDPLLHKSIQFDPRNPHLTQNGQLLHEVDVHTNRRVGKIHIRYICCLEIKAFITIHVKDT